MVIWGQGSYSYPLSGKKNVPALITGAGLYPFRHSKPRLKGFPCSIPAYEGIFRKIPCSLAYTPIQILSAPSKTKQKTEHKGEEK